jgi:hypothetical protein
MTKQKLLYVAPHISTGGMPQYLLEQIQTFINKFEVYVIEYANYSDAYVVQKNQIKEILPPENYFCLGEDKTEILDILKSVKPNIVHFQEPICWFIDEEITSQLLNIPDRPFYIETPHSKNALPTTCGFNPDKYVLVSKWAYEKFAKNTSIPCDLWEYPIKNFTPDKEKYQSELGLDPNYHHVLNVGLFTPGKNQSEIFDVAKFLQDKPIKFHFVGNQAPNFQSYWEPLMSDKPDNCIVWGERNDVYKFLQACDLFYFSSNLELFPLVVREALSYKLPLLMKRLDTYLDVYDNNDLITFINNDIKESKNKILNFFNYDI